MSKCKHYWHYVPTVYGGPKGGSLVRRYCPNCKLEQVGVVERWRKAKPNEFDQTAEQAANE